MKAIPMATIRTRLFRTGLVLGVAALTTVGTTSVASAGGSHQQITGSGSNWAANAVNQWVADVEKEGLQIVFTANGSASGRRDFADQTSDFAVSDIGYQGVDPESGASDTPCQDPTKPSTCLDYAYVPIVAGGTAFPYQIRVGGQLVTNLRLSGETLAKIFTNQITNWDDPEITSDNNGRKLPSLPIIPVVHSEGSGTSAQFTRYLATEYPNIWTPYNNGKDVEAEYYPQKAPQVAQNGSDGVIDFVTSKAANGAIGYDEYSYALGKNYPVVALENKAGYFTEPTQYNVAVALTKAKINMDKSSPNYLLQNLNQVYTNPDKRTYAMSSYSYGVIPTGPNSNDARMNTAKRQTIADFLDYSVCQGQGEIGPIGYSALPINLVEASFAQIKKLHSADSGVDITQAKPADCHNPTFEPGNPDGNYLAKIAPEPLACQKVGAGPCGANQNTAPNGAATKNGKVPGTTKSGTSPGTNTTTTGNNTTGDNTTGTTTGNSSTGTNPDGSAPTGGSSATTSDGSAPVVAGDGTGTNSALIGTPTSVGGTSNGGLGGVLTGLALVELLLILTLPAAVTWWLRKRKRSA